MSTKNYDATTEFRPFERDANWNGRHPRSRKGATRRKAERAMKAKTAMKEVQAPVKAAAKGKKK